MPMLFKSPEEAEGYRTGLSDSLGTTLDYLGRPQNALAGMLDFNQGIPTSDRIYRGLTLGAVNNPRSEEQQ
jgi:hypothetical protein